jgi:N6-L-threonylcarbamoyladenine synthase
VVSGGHTNLFYVRDYLIWEALGATRDDAAGEAFDKVAKILNLGYPGGPVIEKMAKRGRPDKIRFPRSYLEENSLDFSFSGLKTAVLYYVRDSKKPVTSPPRGISEAGRGNQPAPRHKRSGPGKPDIAASFQEAAVGALVEKAVQACLLKGVKNFVAGGGVVANRRLREVLRKRLNRRGIDTYFPSFKLCQDNAAMVAGLGYQQYRRGIVSNLNLEAQPNLTIMPKRKRKKEI